MTPEEYKLMLSLIEKAKIAAMFAVKNYAPKDAPFVAVTDFDEISIEMSGDEGYAGSDYHILYLPVEKILHSEIVSA